MVNFIKKFDKIIDIFNKTLHRVSNFILLFITFLITFDVIGRFFFNRPIMGAYEITELSTGLLVFFAFAATHKYKEHIAIGFLIDRSSARFKNIIEGFIEMFVFIVLCAMGWRMFLDALRSIERNVTTS